MAHFAKIDENNIVIDVNVVNNDVINNLPFPESEPLGVAFLKEWSGGYTNWKQTSYNSNFRGNYSGIGFTYDPVNDVFYAPQPYPSWKLNSLWQWEAPIPKPAPDYWWSEADLNWLPAPTMPTGEIPSVTL